jgi:hypothetical protein
MRIDHLVWYCSDLDLGRRMIASKSDWPPAYGGEHPGEGTANWLLGLGPETYLEILGRDPAQQEASLDPAIRSLSGHGLYHWAVSGLDLGILQKRAGKAGLAGSELVSGGRRKPDGSRLSWTCFGLQDHPFGALVPFFIDWRDSDHPARTAPRGAHLARFEVSTPDPGGLQRLYDVLGLEIEIRRLPEAGLAATLEAGRGRIELRSFSPLPRGYII